MRRETVWLVAPYATWMALMTLLPATPAAYAVRTAVVALLLVPALRALTPRPPIRLFDYSIIRLFDYSTIRLFLLSLLVGLLVCVLWVLPEHFEWPWYRTWCIVGEGGTPAVAEASAGLVAMRLVGSAFIVSVAEELFFRRWMIGFAGFWWTVALFAVEHDRWLVGAMAGAVYGLLYLKRGLGAAIVAHATTNLALGLWVLRSGQWQFW